MYNKLNFKNFFSKYSIMLGIPLLIIGLSIFYPETAFAQATGTNAFLDPTFRTPAPPNEAFPQNSGHVLIATIGMLIISLIMVVIAIIDGKRFKSTVPIALVMAAAVCVVPESIDNYLGGCYWSQSHDPHQLFYFLMGREFDYYVIIMWWAFGAVLSYIFYAVLLREAKTKTVWIAFIISGIADIIFEEILLGYGGIYMYFGHQPLILIRNFPCWWLFANVSALFLSVAIAYRFRDWFNGFKSLLILLLMPFCYIGGFALVGMPTIFVINGDFSPFVTQLGGILTCIMALIQTAGTMYLILGRNPFDIKSVQKNQIGNINVKQTV